MAVVAASPPRVAVCLVGALRNFHQTWPSIRHNLVVPTAAAVFVTISNQQDAATGSRSHQPAEHMTLDRLASIIGSRLHGAVVMSDEDLTPAKVASWAGKAASEARKSHYQWQYYLKRWACNRLVAEYVGLAYEIVVTMRPDLFVFEPWRFSIQNEHLHRQRDEAEPDHRNRHERPYLLQVGNGSAVAFGEAELIMNDFTSGCINDWVAVSTLRTSTTIEQLIHHMHSADTFMPCHARPPSMVLKSGEIMLGSFLWRAGVERRLHPLHIELARTLEWNHDQIGPYVDSAHYVRHNSRQWGGAWNRYCVDAAYERFGDAFVLEDDGSRPQVAESRLLPAITTPFSNILDNTSIHFLNCQVPVEVAPPCNDTVDLMQPLVPCTRMRLGQRLSPIGKGQPFPTACNGQCESLPNATYVINAAMVPAVVLPAPAASKPEHPYATHSHRPGRRLSLLSGPRLQHLEHIEGKLKPPLGVAVTKERCLVLRGERPYEHARIRVCRRGVKEGRVEVSHAFDDDDLDHWMVLRVSGPHPQTALFTQDPALPSRERNPWTARFRLCQPGTYTIHVRALLREPWLDWASSFTWKSRLNHTPCAARWGEGVLLDNHAFHHDRAATESCSAGLWSWASSDARHSAIGAAMLQRITPSPHPNATHLAGIFDGLQYIEASTAPALIAPPAVQATSPRASPPVICLLGDSQMRTLTDSLTGLQDPFPQNSVNPMACSYRGSAQNLISSKACPPQKMVGFHYCTRKLWNCTAVLEYYKAVYGAPHDDRSGKLHDRSRVDGNLNSTWQSTLKLRDHLGERCTAVLYNSGQWWASWKLKPDDLDKYHTQWKVGKAEPYTPTQYAQAVLMRQIAALKDLNARWPDLRVAWLATNPYPINVGGAGYMRHPAQHYDMSRCPPKERRFPHLLAAYNNEARRICAAHGVSFLDTWDITLPLFDISADGAHFALRHSPIAKAQATRILAWALGTQSPSRGLVVPHRKD